MGYVHHAKYLEYFEAGRHDYMRAKGFPYSALEESGFFLVLTDARLTYRRPARYGMELTVKSRVLKCTYVRICFDYVIENDGEVLCSGSTDLACVDSDGKPRRLPENFRSILGTNWGTRKKESADMERRRT
jgi:acyl-CoA thioester hydrolase